MLQEEESWECCILWASNFVVGVVLGECARIDGTAWRCKMSSKRAVVEEIDWLSSGSRLSNLCQQCHAR